MKILVTGGAGFIGSHLVKALNKQGHDVIVLDDLSSGSKSNVPKGTKFIKGDVREINQLNLPKKIDVVFHLAAQIDVRISVDKPLFDAGVNVLGTLAVLDYARQAGVKKFIFSSSGGAIYGPTKTIPTTERVEVKSSSPYGIAKYAAEQYVSLYSRLFNMGNVILRYSNVYGPGQSTSRESGVIAIFSDQLLKGQPITVYGDGGQTRDFVYVEDVVKANIAAMNSPVQGTFNISTAKETTINELVEHFNDIFSQEIEVKHAPARPGEERRSCLSYTQAKSILGWEPKVDLRQGLQLTIHALKNDNKLKSEGSKVLSLKRSASK